MDVVAVVLVIWCIYVSDALWWTTSDALLFTGTRVGNFRARRGPSLDVRDGKGFFAAPLFPPFQCSFECVISADEDARPSKRVEIERRVRRSIELSQPLRMLGGGLWVFLFIVAPVAVAWWGLSSSWVLLLAILILWLVAIAVSYRRSWRALYSEDPHGWRGDAALMLLSPPGAIRAADRLTRHALQSSNALRVLEVLTTPEHFSEIARLLYFDEPTPRQTTARREIERLLESPALAHAFASPPEREPGMMGFCRRCHGQLLRGDGECPDCAWIVITPFEAEA